MALFLAAERIRFILSLPKQINLIVRLFRDARVAAGLKILAVLIALLAISPLDPLADIPLIGQLDDLALLALIASLFVRLCPKDVVAEHSRTAGLAGLGQKTFGSRPMRNVTPSR